MRIGWDGMGSVRRGRGEIYGRGARLREGEVGGSVQGSVRVDGECGGVNVSVNVKVKRWTRVNK